MLNFYKNSFFLNEQIIHYQSIKEIESKIYYYADLYNTKNQAYKNVSECPVHEKIHIQEERMRYMIYLFTVAELYVMKLNGHSIEQKQYTLLEKLYKLLLECYNTSGKYKKELKYITQSFYHAIRKLLFIHSQKKYKDIATIEFIECLVGSMEHYILHGQSKYYNVPLHNFIYTIVTRFKLTHTHILFAYYHILILFHKVKRKTELDRFYLMWVIGLLLSHKYNTDIPRSNKQFYMYVNHEQIDSLQYFNRAELEFVIGLDFKFYSNQELYRVQSISEIFDTFSKFLFSELNEPLDYIFESSESSQSIESSQSSESSQSIESLE